MLSRRWKQCCAVTIAYIPVWSEYTFLVRLFKCTHYFIPPTQHPHPVATLLGEICLFPVDASGSFRGSSRQSRVFLPAGASTRKALPHRTVQWHWLSADGAAGYRTARRCCQWKFIGGEWFFVFVNQWRRELRRWTGIIYIYQLVKFRRISIFESSWTKLSISYFSCVGVNIRFKEESFSWTIVYRRDEKLSKQSK